MVIESNRRDVEMGTVGNGDPRGASAGHSNGGRGRGMIGISAGRFPGQPCGAYPACSS